MPDTRVRVHLPVTVRLRGAPAPDQVDLAGLAAAQAVRRAVAQARDRAHDAGWDLTLGPRSRVAVQVPPTEIPNAGGQLLVAVEAAVRTGVRLGAAQALSDLGALLSIADADRSDGVAGVAAAEDPPTLAMFATADDIHTAALKHYPKAGELLPRGSLHTGVYGIWTPTMKPVLFWVAGVVTAGRDRGKLVWGFITLIMGDLKNNQWTPRGAGNEPAALLPGSRYRLSALVAKKPPKPQKGPPPARAYVEDEGGAHRRPLYLSDQGHNLLRNKVIRFAVPVGKPAEPEVPPPPKPPLADDVRKRRQGAWRWLHGYAALPAESQGEPEWLWEWFGYLNIQPASVRANLVVRQAIMYLISKHGERAIIDMDLGPLQKNDLWNWRRRFLKAFCLMLAISMLTESRARMEQFRTMVAAPEWKSKFAGFFKSLSDTAATVNEYRRLERRLRLADKLAKAIEEEGDSNATEEQIEETVAMTFGNRAEMRRKLAAMQPPTGEEELLTLAGEAQPLVILLTIRQHNILPFDPRTQAEQIAEAVDEFAVLDPEALSRVIDSDLEKLIAKTVEGQNRLAAEPDDAYQLAVVQREAGSQLQAWFQAVPSAKLAWEQLIDHDWVSWLGLAVGLVLLAFLFPPLAGLVAVAGFGISTYSAYTSLSRAVRLRALSRARLAQYGFQQLVSDEEVSAAYLAAAMDTLFSVLDIGPSARAITRGTVAVARGTGALARRAAGALGIRLEEAMLRAHDFAAWPQWLNEAAFRQLTAAIERQRPLLTQGGAQLGDAEQLAGELFEATRLNMVARYEQHVAEVSRRFGAALESGLLRTEDIRALRDWLAKQRLRPDDYLRDIAQDRHFFDELVKRQARGETAAAAGRQVTFLPVEAELAAMAEQLGPLSKLLGPERVFAFREATGLTQYSYRQLSERLATILRRVDGPEDVLNNLERILGKHPEAGVVLDALAGLPNPHVALGALTPELLEAAGRHGGLAEVVRALHEPAAAGARVGRQFVDLDMDRVEQLFREVLEANGSRYVQRWNPARGGWEHTPQLPPPLERVPRVVTPVSEEARTAARQSLESMAARRTPVGGRPTAAARRIAATQQLAQTTAEGQRFLDEVLTAAGRENPALAGRILEYLQYLERGPTSAEFAAMADFLRRGGEARELAAILARGRRQPYLRSWIRDFLEELPHLREGDLRGLSVVFELHGYGQRGAETVLNIHRYIGRANAKYAFGALNDLAAHSEGLERVLVDLASFSQVKNQGALGQLLAARRLLEENPGVRLRFEVPDINRVVDIEVITRYTGVALRQVEVKDVTQLFWLTRPHTTRQLARDIARSVRATAGTGERPLSRIQWLIRRGELEQTLSQRLTDAAYRAEIAARLGKAPADVTFRDVVRAEMSGAFEHPVAAELGDALQAARRDFDDNFDKVVVFF
jgi:hypothetical protein